MSLQLHLCNRQLRKGGYGNPVLRCLLFHTLHMTIVRKSEEKTHLDVPLDNGPSNQSRNTLSYWLHDSESTSNIRRRLEIERFSLLADLPYFSRAYDS